MSLDGLKKWENTSINARITDADARAKAGTIRSVEQRPRMNLRLVIPLDVAATAQNPYVVAGPVTGFFVEGASDATTQVNMSLATFDGYATDNAVGLRINASGNFNSEVGAVYLTWAAQAGKILTINFFYGVDFRPGSTVQSFNGAVSIVNGVSVVTGVLGVGGASSSLTVTNAAAVQLCQVNLSRGEFDFYTDQDIWLGDASVAVNRGIKISAGSNFTWSNTGILYAIAAGADATVSGMEQRN